MNDLFPLPGCRVGQVTPNGHARLRAAAHGLVIVGVRRQIMKNPFPDTGSSPEAKAPVRVLPVTRTLRKVTSGASGQIPVQNRLHEQAIVRRRHALTWIRRDEKRVARV